MEHEYEILHDIFDGFLRREARRHTAADIRTALPVMHRLLGRARATSLSAYDAAHDEPPVPDGTWPRLARTASPGLFFLRQAAVSLHAAIASVGSR